MFIVFDQRYSGLNIERENGVDVKLLPVVFENNYADYS